MSVSGDQCIVLQWMGMLSAVPLASYVAPRGDFRKRSAHGPLFPDHVRTMVFSVHLFRTFSAQKADQRWTVQRGRPVAKRVARLPNRGVTANQARNGRICGPTKKVRTWSAFSGPCPDKFKHRINLQRRRCGQVHFRFNAVKATPSYAVFSRAPQSRSRQ